MKRIVFLIFISMLLTSCSSVSQSKFIEENKTKPSIQDYCPFMGNIRISYGSKNGSIGKKDIYVDYLKGNRLQLRTVTQSSSSVQVIEVKDGELRLIASRDDFSYRDNLLLAQNSKPEVLLKEPLQKGTSWTLPDGSKRYISDVDVDIKIPLGDFKALEVTTENGDNITKDYYALNLGPIKTIYKNKDSEIETYVDGIDTNVQFNQTIKVYYPYNHNGYVYLKRKASFKTNDELKDVFEKFFKSSPGMGIVRLISDKTEIKKLYLNTIEHKVVVDFNFEFKKYLDSVPSNEGEIVQSIVDTLGDYYNVDKVYITVDGDEYDFNRVFYVNYKSIREYK